MSTRDAPWPSPRVHALACGPLAPAPTAMANFGARRGAQAWNKADDMMMRVCACVCKKRRRRETKRREQRRATAGGDDDETRGERDARSGGGGGGRGNAAG